MKKRVALLGSTGSIGKSALALARKHPEAIEVVALCAGNQIDALEKDVREFRPKLVATRTDQGRQELLARLGQDAQGITVISGVEGAEAVASHPDVDIVLSAIVGAAGLRPTLAAARHGKTIALANKESMVVAGALVTHTARKHGARILPVDSEHSAIHQCLPQPYQPQHVERLILTASGGPFFLKPEIDLSKVTREQALKHPNWSMGPKITIDSATLMNKGLEMIEAHWLFDLPPSKIDVIVHPKSIVHSMVEFIDASVVAQLGVPDMTGPIAYALFYPNRVSSVMARLDLAQIGQLHFYPPDHARFPAINLAYQAMKAGPLHPAVLNAANEVSVQAFLDEQISFTDITDINRRTLEAFTQSPGDVLNLEVYLQTDEWARQQARTLILQSRK